MLCNGMDAVGGYAFDHYHGWKSGRNFSLGLGPASNGTELIHGGGGRAGGGAGSGGDGIPSTIAASQYCGGRPARLDPPGVALLALARLRLVNLHYQVGLHYTALQIQTSYIESIILLLVY